jgi:hypothetical protein
MNESTPDLYTGQPETLVFSIANVKIGKFA